MRKRLRQTVWIAVAALVWQPALRAVEPESWDVFQQRRRALAERLPDGAIVLFGVDEQRGRVGAGPLLQESNFYYLSGCREPGATLLIEPEHEGGPYRETLFLGKASGVEQEWNGRRIDPALDTAAAETGFSEVLDDQQLRARLRAALKRQGRIYALTGDGPEASGRPGAGDVTVRLKDLGVSAEPASARAALAQMRLIKSEQEIRAIERAVAASVAAHWAAWRTLRPGMTEYEVFAEMSRAMIRGGALRPAYPPIVASGPNGTTLHYVELTRTIKAGELVLMDVGGDFNGYAADLTRTVPASGRFSERQRQIYDWVLEAQKLAIAGARPGVRLTGPDSLTELVERFFDSKEKGLSSRFRHAVGHFVGLDVHDPSPLSTALAEGMVITIEPGVYLPDEGFGVRIEDMLLITADGARLLSAELPREAEAIERATGSAAKGRPLPR